MRMILRHYVCSARRKSRRCPGMSFLVRSLQATGMALSWFHGTNGKPTFHRLANLSWLFEICNHFGDIAAWSPKSLKTVAQIAFFEKKVPLQANLHKCFPKGFVASQIHVLCAIFVEIGRSEIGKVVRYLPDKNTSSPRSLTLASARIAPKISQGQR